MATMYYLCATWSVKPNDQEQTRERSWLQADGVRQLDSVAHCPLPNTKLEDPTACRIRSGADGLEDPLPLLVLFGDADVSPSVSTSQSTDSASTPSNIR